MPKGTQISKDDIESVKKLHGTGLFNTTQIAKITKRGWGTVHDIIKAGFSYSKYKSILKGKRPRSEKTGLTFNDAETNEIVHCIEDGHHYELQQLPDAPGETVEVTYLTKIQQGVALIVEGVVDQILEETHDDKSD